MFKVRPHLFVIGLVGCGYAHEPRGVSAIGVPNPKALVLGWTASFQPLGPQAAQRELAVPYGGPALLAHADALAYLARPDVLAAAEQRARDAGSNACYGLGGNVIGWQDGLPVCNAPPSVRIPKTTLRPELQPSDGPPAATDVTRAAQIVAWGEVTCSDDVGRAVVGWTMVDRQLRVVCGGGSGMVNAYVPATPAILLDTCVSDIDSDGQPELVVLLDDGPDRRLEVLDGDRSYELDRTFEGGPDAGQAVVCGTGWVGMERGEEAQAAWRWTREGYEEIGLPG